MQLSKAERRQARIKMALQGPSGSGKTYSSLLVAYGLCGDWNKTAIIDTENHSADLYSSLGPYNVLTLPAPFTPERFIQAMEVCEAAGMEVIIIDSVTHEWENLLDYHGSLQGNSFTNWNKVTPRHQAFVQKVLQSPAHIIATIRTKSDYVLAEKNGKMVPEKVGLKAVQRDGLEYEFTLSFDLDMKNHAVASKDRTGLFFGKPEQKLSVHTGQQIRDWCNTGVVISIDDMLALIQDCQTVKELYSLYKAHPQFQQALKSEFETRKRLLIINQETLITSNNPQSFSTNGTDH